MGGVRVTDASMAGAGVVADANEACLHCWQMYGTRARVALGRICLTCIRNRGGIVVAQVNADRRIGRCTVGKG